MGIFPGFSLINQNTKQPTKAESKKSGKVKPKSVSETYPEDREELKKQMKLWRASEKKYAWHDYPPKVKVTKYEDLCHMNIQFTIGLPPEAVFDIFTTYENPSWYSMMKKRPILEHRSSKVLSDRGPTEKLVQVEKEAPWRFLWWSGAIPVHLNLNESRKDFSALYLIPKKNMMFKEFNGKWKIEPWYIDNSRYCKPRLPKNREEYRQCTGGKGLIGSRVTVDQSFKPSSYLNFPPLSWYIRRVTIKTTKALVEDLQVRAAIIKSV
ncbi:PREDICTED: uncharacterized protein LOC104756731 [Camelina sativa]|uniref:Uncharacterized protein LOC104756731 n=1 Tax=Camelina sativa TaxID=90675 RepID=A0ABM0WXQ3_CAMSA|nr:PREDICTED: uncharacterized protein LOC104756731 [Camelina sativa]